MTPDWIGTALSQLSDAGLLRELAEVEERRPGAVRLSGEWLVNLAGNDYLGLSMHPGCVDAARAALGALGCGTGASRIVTGGLEPHRQLEQRVSRWLYPERSVETLLFPTGYQANLGCLTALLGPGDLVYSDARNHASIIDGCRYSRAEIRIYPHADLDALERLLVEDAGRSGRRLIVSDSLFSMDGTLAPARGLRSLADRFGALLMVDEAHAVGSLGPQGRGWCAQQGVVPDVLIGTFSKALGSLGGFACADRPLIRFLVNRARAFVYTTSVPPAVAAAATAAVEIVSGTEGERLRGRLLGWSTKIADRLGGAGFSLAGRGTPILSRSLPDHREASVVSHRLREAGFLVWAYRPPTVPRETSLLRVSLSAAISDRELDGLIPALRDALA